MILVKDKQKISLDNENHISAFLANGWTEAKASAISTPKEEKAEDVAEVETEKKPAKKKQEN